MITSISGASKLRCTGPLTRFDVPTRRSGAKSSPSIGHSSPSDRPVTAPSG
jgi:hypothetical protein